MARSTQTLGVGNKLVNNLGRTVCFVGLLLVAGGALGQRKSTDDVPTVGLCNITTNPERYYNKPVRLRAVYRVGFEWQEIYSLGCVDAPSVWLEFSDDIDESSHKQLKKIDKGNHFSINVGVVMVGRLTGYAGGYGHMNGYKLSFTVDRIESATRLDNHGYYRNALSPEDRKRIEDWENLEPTPNKSLNRSGGSVSRIKRDPAKVLGFAPPG